MKTLKTLKNRKGLRIEITNYFEMWNDFEVEWFKIEKALNKTLN